MAYYASAERKARRVETEGLGAEHESPVPLGSRPEQVRTEKQKEAIPRSWLFVSLAFYHGELGAAREASTPTPAH